MPSLPHDIFLEDFLRHQEPAAERADRISVLRLRAPPFSRAGFLFAARSLAEQPPRSLRDHTRPATGSAFWERIFPTWCCNSGGWERFCCRFHGDAGRAVVPVAGVQSPIAKTLGGIWLLMFTPALLAILPGHFRWMGAIPIEGLAGRIVGDVLIRYLTLPGHTLSALRFWRSRST